MSSQKIKINAFELDHAETLLDTIFGVVIALALTDLPQIISNLFLEFSSSNITTLFLLLSSLLFCAFYWLESRHFVVEQRLFDDAIDKYENQEKRTVSLPLSIFLIGTLAMMGLAAAILQYSYYEFFHTYFLLNLIFWIVDLCGTYPLRKIYYKYRSKIEKLKSSYQYSWFLGHIISYFFFIYGLGNIFFFTLILFGDYIIKNIHYKPIVAILTLAFVLFRHLYSRSFVYSWWLEKKVVRST